VRRRLPLQIAGLVVLLAACGTTVPGATTAQVGGAPVANGQTNGLGAPATGPVAASPGAIPGAIDAPATDGGTAPVAQGTSGPVLPDGQVAPPTSGSANRSPVKVGMIYTFNDDAAASAGVDNGNTFTSKAAFDAMVKAYNARGGVGGRKIVPVAVELSSNSTDLEGDLQAACDKFTQDEHVAVVLSSIGLFSETFSGCLAKAGTPQIASDYALGDVQSVSQLPSFLAMTTLNVDDRETVLLTKMRSLGRLKPADKLGVVIEGCPYNQRAFKRTVEPLAKRLGVPVAQSVETRCFGDIGDLGGLGSDMQSAVLRFQTNGITHVMFVSGSVEGNAMFLFATAAEGQNFHPKYLLTSVAILAVQETNTPKAQLANAYGIGWIPSIDASHSAATGPAGKRCLKDLQAGAGITPQSPADRYYAASTCDVFSLYDAALRADRGASDARSVMSAVGGLGGGFASAAALGEATDFRGGRRTGAAQARQFAWSVPCGCFDYTGSPFSLVS
jgi:hypothetical protein